MQGEFADLGQQGLLASLELLGEIARMTAQSLGALGDEVVLPLLDLGESQSVLTSSLRGGGLALEDVDDEGSLRLAVQRCGLSASVSISTAGEVMVALGLLMAEGSGLRVNSDKWEGAATAQKLCYGYAAASSRYARRDLHCAFTKLLRGVTVCLILDQFGELITCPIQEGDGAPAH